MMARLPLRAWCNWRLKWTSEIRSAGYLDLKANEMKRKASAEWQGSLKEGKGIISTESGLLHNAQYSFGTRFENGSGTNPENSLPQLMRGAFQWRYRLN